MKKSNGQALFLLIAILPVLLLLLGAVIELGLLSYNKIKISSVTKTIISGCYPDCEEEKVKDLYQKNNIDIEALVLKSDENLELKLEAKTPSFLGKTINKDYYNIEINYDISMDNGKIIYQKGK